MQKWKGWAALSFGAVYDKMERAMMRSEKRREAPL